MASSSLSIDAVLLQAKLLSIADRHEEAFRLLAQQAPNSSALHLFRANYVVDSERDWLQSLNDYLSAFDLFPIHLTPGTGSRFQRLFAHAVPKLTNGPLVTVLMPAYNAEKTICQAICSILNQTWLPLELILVDDASSDSTWTLAKQLADRDERIKMFRNSSNVGPYVSKNLALTASSGDYITAHDADDWSHPQRIQKHMEGISRHSSPPDISMMGMLRMTEEGLFTEIGKIGRVSPDGAIRDALTTCMFESRFLRECLGSWDCVRFGADAELIDRAEATLGAACEKIQQIGIIALDHPNSLTNDEYTGICKLNGPTPPRLVYRKQWKRWHKTLTKDSARLPFPPYNRTIRAHPRATVSESLISSVWEQWVVSYQTGIRRDLNV